MKLDDIKARLVGRRVRLEDWNSRTGRLETEFDIQVTGLATVSRKERIRRFGGHPYGYMPANDVDLKFETSEGEQKVCTLDRTIVEHLASKGEWVFKNANLTGGIQTRYVVVRELIKETDV